MQDSTAGKYEIDVFWSETDGCYLAEVLDLPGCLADGMTRVEAMQNAEIVAREWIETALALGRDVPAPRSRLMPA